MKIPARIFSVMAFFLIFSLPAQAAPPGPEEVSFISPYEEVIARTRHSVGIQGGYGFKLWNKYNMEVAEVVPYIAFPITDPVGERFRGVLEYKIEGVVGMITDLDNKIIAGGSPIGFRYNFTGFGGRLVPYAEGTIGAVYADVPSGVQGSRFNFIESLGVGAQYFVSRRTTVNLQLRYWHLSNGGINQPNHGNNLGFVLVGMGFY